MFGIKTQSQINRPSQQTTEETNTSEGSLTEDTTNKPNFTFTVIRALSDRIDTLIKLAMVKLEKYNEEKLDKAINQVIKFTTTMTQNTVEPSQAKTVQAIANSKKVWGKRVQIVPLQNTMEVMISDLREGFRQDAEQLIRVTLLGNLEQHNDPPEIELG